MQNLVLDKLQKDIEDISHNFHDLKTSINKVIIGQDDLIEKLIISLLADGHVFIEGVPGLAKTLTVKTLASKIESTFNRIQFTPDLLPADIIGTLIYNQKLSSFEVKKGPIFANIILADEINRSPAKVQSALLEAMQERQISIGEETFLLDRPFLVLATQNPVEQEGTYPLPEAQIDRFMFKLLVNYPEYKDELTILKQMGKINQNIESNNVINPNLIFQARKLIDKIYISDNIENYIVSIVQSTRRPSDYGMKDINELITLGASPRATIFLAVAAKANAFLNNRGYVIPDDIRHVGPDILRHRILLSYEAEAEEITTENLINRIFETIPIP